MARHSPRRPARPAAKTGWADVHAVVRRIPRGRVATYGQVAGLAGIPGHARQVGYALHALGPDTDVPWQRVINARGGISPRAEPWAAALQRRLLEREGVRFDARGRVDLARYAWRPRRTAARQAAPTSTAPSPKARTAAGSGIAGPARTRTEWS